MEGAERIMLGSNNYLGSPATRASSRRARDALERYGTGLTGSRLLNGTLDLHLELEREIAEWMGTEDAIVFTTGHQANVGTLGTILGPGDTVIADSGDHASILDGCLLSRAKLRPFRHNRLDKLEKMLERAAATAAACSSSSTASSRWRATSRRCRRSSSSARARRAADGRRGARRRRARRARRGHAELFGVEDASTCAWARSRSRSARCGGFIAGSHEVIDFLRIQSRAFLFTAAAVPAAVGAALAALRIVRSDEGAALFARVLDNAATSTRAARARLPRRRPSRCRRLDGRSRRSSRSSSATTGRPCCCGARSTTRASSSTSALHPAVPPAGALLRTSVMATHDQATLDRALERLRDGQGRLRGGARPLPSA
jgi:8-amino-7-oxononanoate synthase